MHNMLRHIILCSILSGLVINSSQADEKKKNYKSQAKQEQLQKNSTSEELSKQNVDAKVDEKTATKAGWREFTFGMTEEQLVAANSNLVANNLDSDNYYSNYKLMSQSVSGHNFDVEFVFGKASKKLEQISLDSNRTETIATACPDVESTLTGKYGNPTYQNKAPIIGMHKDTTGETIRIKWLSSKVKISLYCLVFGSGVMVITYFPINNDAASSL